MATENYAQRPTLTREFRAQQPCDAAVQGDAESEASRHNVRPLDRQLSQGLGWFSVGLGVAQLLAPRALGRAIGVGEYPLLMRLLGLREIASGLGLLSQRQPSRWSWARVAGDAMDLALLGAAAAGPRAERRRVAVATAAVASVAALDVYAGRRLQGVTALAPEPVHVSETVTVNTDPQTAYGFWSHFENLPRFMRHLESVVRVDDRVSHWVARAPAGSKVEWDSEIIIDQPPRRLAWRTLPGSQIEHEGTVDFEPAAGKRGTKLRVALRYVPPLGRIAVPIARLLGEEPQLQITEDLRRFKQLVETGEVATIAGQSAGRRSLLGRATLGRWMS